MNEQMKCISFQQPHATLIALGIQTVAYRTLDIEAPIKDLVVCSAKSARAHDPIEGLAYGYALGLVDVVKSEPFTEEHCPAAMMSKMPKKKGNAWILENARLIQPFRVHASSGFFYVDGVPNVFPVTEDVYMEYMPRVAYFIDPENAVLTTEILFTAPSEVCVEHFGL